MCILCVVQKWSRRVATMLPWLVIPLIFLWALSQFLPQGLRFEITSPRVACVLVLLLTLFWYEILMPQLSAWRVRRAARLRERHRTQAIELQKLRKSATRRCRNCQTPYRDQNPGGGRFMCSYCGHVSKRPVLDIPGRIGGTRIIGNLVGNPQIIGNLAGKDGWKDSHDWTPESAGDWARSAPRYLLGNDDDDRCSAERSYSGMFVLVCRLLSWFFIRTRWLWRKVFRAGEVGYSDTENKSLSSRSGAFPESRGEKARRKAEEKRQVRLEKEMLEEEERKQREEVARLVEERRKLRDEKLEAEKKHSKSLSFGRERGNGKETEKRRQERRKDKDKGSSKSNSDGEDLEKTTGRECEFDKKNAHERRDSQKTMAENNKSNASEPVHGNKVMANKTRYFDRMKGTFLSSSRGFNSASFLGGNARNRVASATKTSKPAVGSVDHRLVHGNTSQFNGHALGKSTQNGDNQPMGPDAQPRTPVLKKSWHQLFTRTSAVASYPDTNTSTCSTWNNQLEDQSVQSIDKKTQLSLSTDNQINSGRTLPSTIHPLADSSFNSKSIAHSAESVYDRLVTEPGHHSVPEDAELFEDPCYVPDPISLLGPVSESLDDFPLDLGGEFVTNGRVEGPHLLKNAYMFVDVNRPSPIEPPMSRLRSSEERHTASGQVIGTQKSEKVHTSNLHDSSNAHEQGTWQMWGTPLALDGLGLSTSSRWLFPIVPEKSIQEDGLPLSHNTMISQLAKENHTLPAIYSPGNSHVSTPQNGGIFSPLGHGLNDSDSCIRNSLFQQMPVDRKRSHFLPHDLIDNTAQNEVTYGSSDSSGASQPFELSAANSWSMGEWTMHGTEDAGARFPNTNPDVQSAWLFNLK